MKRDIFRRPARMIHKFGDLEEHDDLLGIGTFDMPMPRRVDDLSKRAAGRPCEVQTDGQHFYRPEPSPVCKPSGGYASMNGPTPDVPQIVGMPVPVGTKRRLGPLRTDK